MGVWEGTQEGGVYIIMTDLPYCTAETTTTLKQLFSN